MNEKSLLANNKKNSLKGLFINHLHFHYFLHAWKTKGDIKFNAFP